MSWIFPGGRGHAGAGCAGANHDGVSYILPEEVPALPRLPEHKAWHYTPLGAVSSTPELMLMWVDGRQVMLIQEAMGSAHWKSGTGLRTTGRPACGALALAYHHAEAVLSFGCAGMRTFTEIPDGFMLLVVPAKRWKDCAVASSRPPNPMRRCSAYTTNIRPRSPEQRSSRFVQEQHKLWKESGY